MDTLDLEKLKKMLENRLEEILGCLDIEIDGEFDLGNLNDEMDVISANLQHNLNEILLQKHGQEIKKITKALQKMTNNIYGICEMCDEEIVLERLLIKPHAEYCVKCREIYEKNKKGK
ncbi:TraR/DksA C4-type zinc finger protein [Helicobacter anatolicus]|uniref:TraR/DksA C4-type zinc finger protein n=1 Tax=Helicobacter anatolicus TaxID=2905874 RepID=UPI001E5E4678|nr:TraR/DksA C4-type zinc finger protein [Helicobacter anatolicus]MCE3038558.1 TraR/DksA C4-type zinc finger protein [Helicobacter anatolicus]